MSKTDPSSGACSPGSTLEDRTVQAVLEVERGGPCFLDNLDSDILAVDIQFHDGECHCDVTLDDQDGEGVTTKHCNRQACSYCPGIVFSTHGCIPRFRRTGDNSFVIRTFAPDAATIADVVEELRSVCDSVRLRRLTDADSDANLIERIFEVDVSVLTGKQRDALERAIEGGYYEPSGGKSLTDLAEEFDISKSALSQRLSRAESKLMKQLVDTQ